MAAPTHRQLVERAAAKDGGAIAALLVHHQANLRTYLRLRAGRLVLERETLDDLAQSVCREILEELPGFDYRGEAPFRKWLFHVAENKIRGRQRYWLAERRDPGREASDVSAASQPGIYATPSRIAIAAEDLARFERAFDGLSTDDQDLILQARVVGLTSGQIAIDTGRSPQAVRTALHRALYRIAQRLDM